MLCGAFCVVFTKLLEAPLTEIVLLNPYTDKDAPLDKQSIFDVFARAADGRLIDIEMQLFNKYDIEKRTLYYWSRRYSGQLAEGQGYRSLGKCVTINLMNYKLLGGTTACHSVFHLREDRSGLPLTDDIEVHMLELPKLKADAAGHSGKTLAKWLTFLREGDISSWEAREMENEAAIQKAFETLKYLSQDSEARMQYEARQKFLHDEASMINGARREGLKEGLEQGAAGKAKTVALKMLAKGMEPALVAELTGLASEEIRRLTEGQGSGKDDQ
ncbi:Rpn family recombination-promoting nuclease/putative transposase [Paenibacillus spiritus]|uniref:Rpn family recombination-promoting nuclease/putative transposase n=1 Tax=Paenibacillus spiritus TaxID=2496557 RepID=A0A5J5G0V3_9BACL|nr:Rpn family recombination-promoting nuclease/putative transposase [Paenibacillus spiritus]